MMPTAEQIPNQILAWTRSRLLRWFERNGRSFPWRDTKNPYHVLVAEMLLRRTTGSAVLRVYSDFITVFPTPDALAGAQPELIANQVSTLGLQALRARHLKSMAMQLQSDHSGLVPSDYSSLQALPGVGRYIANAVLNFAFGEAEPLVDGNMLHFLARMFGLSFAGASDDKAWAFMKRLGGRGQDPKLYWAIIDLVARTCLRRSPRCDACPLASGCWWSNNETQSWSSREL